MFTVTEAEKSRFTLALTAKLNRMRQACGEVYRGYALAVYHRILTETPQYSGNAVSNWNVSMGQPNYKVKYTWKESGSNLRWVPRFSKGAPPAIMDSVHSNSAIFAGPFTLTAPYYLANAAENLDKKSYIQLLERNPNFFLRPVNEPGQMVERVANSARTFGILSQARIESLRKLAPGQLGNPGVGL
ncbi:MAG: hypothetical protein ACNA7J_02565 [Wenzhouxiangella sp.]